MSFEVKFEHHYPEYTEVTVDAEPGTVFYQVRMIVGGRDDNGEFLLVLDGPGQGERYYL